MKLRNSTSWPDWFLRRMLQWCRQQVGVRQEFVRLAVFRNSRSAWGGRAWHTGRITVCIGKASLFPMPTHYVGTLLDRDECLIHVTAHELSHQLNRQEHVRNRRGGSWGGSEPYTDMLAKRTLELFRNSRAELLEQWSAPPAIASRPEISRVERNEQKARADLARWERKLKLATTKVRKFRRAVARYERTARAGSASPAAPGNDNSAAGHSPTPEPTASPPS